MAGRPEASGTDANKLETRRTALSEDRTVLSAERTFAAWLRTGLAFLAAGLAAQRYLHGALPGWELHALALTLIACALACFAACAWRDERVRVRLPQAEIHLLPRVLTLGISLLLMLMCLLAAIALWLM